MKVKKHFSVTHIALEKHTADITSFVLASFVVILSGHTASTRQRGGKQEESAKSVFQVVLELPDNWTDTRVVFVL